MQFLPLLFCYIIIHLVNNPESLVKSINKKGDTAVQIFFLENHFDENKFDETLIKPTPLSEEFKLQRDWVNNEWKKTKGYLVFDKIIEA